MIPIQKALWYIESRFRDQISLYQISCASGVTSHYLIRTFGKTFGMSVMRYVRNRRLSEAAKALAAGLPDILSVAMQAGYQSHEAFSRAMRNHFGKSPSEIREWGTTEGLNLQEPLLLDNHANAQYKEREVNHRKSLIVAGLSRRYDACSRTAIPSQWRDYAQQLGQSGGPLGVSTYGVCSNFTQAGAFDYLCGTNSRSTQTTSTDGSRVTMPSGMYASFRHEGHISCIRSTWSAIYNEWLPESAYELLNSPDFELYSEDFDPICDTGSVTIFVPVKAL